MGTRNLIAVKTDGKYKIAQYGQWDGYPSGQGVEVLDFLKSTNLKDFRERVRATRYLSKSECEALTNWSATHPQLSRNQGAKILGLVNGGVVELIDTLAFAGDSLMCEFCYVIDFDSETFEVFEGFNKDKITEGRFVSGDPVLDKKGEYEPVKLAKSYSLNSLPTEEVFLADLEPAQESV